MNRFRCRVWLRNQMWYGGIAAEIAAQQAAFDYGFPEMFDPRDFRSEGAKIMLWVTRLDVVSTEIYEGDVVEMEAGVAGVIHGIVRWRKDQCDYVISQYVGINRFDHKFTADIRLRVVGNICEHSDFMQIVRTGALAELPSDLAGLREQL